MAEHEHEDAPVETPSEGQLCDRLLDYPTHSAYSTMRGERGAKCPRPAKGKDAKGIWACGVHLGADKRGQQARERAATRRRLLSRPVRPSEPVRTETTEVATKLRVIEEGYMDIYVLGTEDIEEAKAALPASVTGYLTAKSGQWIRRKNGLRRVSGQPAPKDAKPGVQFGNVTRSEGP